MDYRPASTAVWAFTNHNLGCGKTLSVEALVFGNIFIPGLKSCFLSALSDVPLHDFYQAINAVSPSLIRVEADQATYDLHIIIRFQLEQAVIDGELDTDDLPTAWNEKYEQYLGNYATRGCRWRASGCSLERGIGRLFSDLLIGKSLCEPVF